MGGLGLDAINDQIPWQLFGEMVSQRKSKMKPLLMDQEFMAGLGNIYSDEVLFQAGLPWDRGSDSLTSNETRRLSRAVGEVLQDAIKNRGTTLSDGEWRDLYDEPGEHQEALPSTDARENPADGAGRRSRGSASVSGRTTSVRSVSP